MAAGMKKISIFNYTDYSLFLKDYYSFQKKQIRCFSYRYFAQKTGVAASVLKDIISGRRKLTVPVMHKYASAMKLAHQERLYFEVLVRFINSKSNAEKNDAFVEMIRLRGRAGIKFLGEDHYEFFSKWYHSAIRELVTLPDFCEDYERIGQWLKPEISAQQVKKSIEFMLELGILQRDRNGRLIQKDTVISSEYEMASAALRTFHTQMVGLAARAIESESREFREISSLTLGLSTRCLARLKERIRIFKEEILAMVVEDKSDSELVCQFNVQLFPLVNRTSGGAAGQDSDNPGDAGCGGAP
jgi:uncharacterized protein (TIGR02147 family)